MPRVRRSAACTPLSIGPYFGGVPRERELQADRQAVAAVNAEVVLQAIEAFNQGGLDRALDLVHPEIEWHTTPGWLGAPVYYGLDGVRKLIAEFTMHFSDYQWAADKLVATGDRVVGRVIHSGTFGGQRVETPFGIVWDLREERVLRVQVFESWDEAASAAGIPAD